MKNINFEQWRSFNLPINLFYLLQERRNSIGFKPINYPTQDIRSQENSSIKYSNSKKTGMINDDIYDKQPSKTISKPIPTSKAMDETEYVKDQEWEKEDLPNPTNTPIEEAVSKNNVQMTTNSSGRDEELMIQESLKSDIYKYLDNISAEIVNPEVNREVLKLIHTAFLKIVTSPNEPKYRKLNITAVMTKYPYASIRKFLEFSIFFTGESGTHMEFMGDTNYLTSIVEKMNTYLIERKVAESTFNPYQTSFVSRGSDLSKFKEIAQPVDFDDLIRQEKMRRSEIITSVTKVDRNPAVLVLSSSEGLGDVINSMNKEEVEHDIENQEYYRLAMKALKESQSDRFKLKTKNEYEKLIRTPVYTKANIRIKFPNEFLLEGTFALTETIGDIHNFIKQYLNDPNEEFFLTTTPPMKKYLKLSETIWNQNLYPSTLMMINFPKIDPLTNQDYKYLNPDGLESLLKEL